VTPGERADLLETLLLGRFELVDAFAASTRPDVMTELLKAARHLDEAIDLLADSAPDLAGEVASRRPIIAVPDCLPQEMH
jgi:hypothetical protein